MQPIREIPPFFVQRFAQLCSSGDKSTLEEIRPANFKDSARFLVEDVLSGFPDLVPTDALEVNAHPRYVFFTLFFPRDVFFWQTASVTLMFLQKQIQKCGTAQLVGYQLRWSVASEHLLIAGDESDEQPASNLDPDELAPTQPMLLFCLNEVLHANSLMSLMKRNLVELDLLLQGRVSAESGSTISAVLRALATGSVPEQWEAGCKSSVMLWISNFMAHVRALHLWVPEVVCMSMPVFWLPYLHNPQALFAALKLVAAAKEGVSLDHIHIEWEVSKKPFTVGQNAPFRNSSLGSSVSYCVSFGGISLIGAQWSPFTQVLEDCDPESVNQLPVICARAGFKASSSDAAAHQPSDAGFSIGDYDCPVYSDRSCSNLLFSMKLKSLVHTAKWAMIGVHAVLCSEEI
jgi:hypothetical protein